LNLVVGEKGDWQFQFAPSTSIGCFVVSPAIQLYNPPLSVVYQQIDPYRLRATKDDLWEVEGARETQSQVFVVSHLRRISGVHDSMRQVPQAKRCRPDGFGSARQQEHQVEGL